MSTDQPVPGKNVVQAIDPTTNTELRSVVGYLPETYTIHYIRDDVAERYSDDDVENAIQELRLETLEQQHVNSVFSDAHGRQQCSMTVFADAVELNFILADGTGVEVAFDPGWIPDQHQVIDAIQESLK